MKFPFYLLLSIILSISFPAKADLLSATLAYNTGEHQQAFKEFQRLAKLGNKDAIYNIGVMFLYGQGIEKNLQKAHAWFSLAADFGLDDARSAARLIEQKINSAEDKNSLVVSFEKLNKEFGFQQYSNTLLPIFSEEQYLPSTDLPPRRIHKVDAKYPKEAYKKGIEGWVWLEFDVDESGAVKDVDVIDAFPDKTFNRAIYNAVRRWRYEPYTVDGKVQDYSNRSLLYHFTTFKGKRYQASFSKQKKNYQKKINQLIEGAEQGNAIVQYYIANWLVAEEHNATRLLKSHWQQPTAGSDLLLASAINGYPNSQYRLGANLLRGEYTQTDRQKGINWILNAAQSGFSYAQYRLARELLDKHFIDYDPAKAKRWLITAAKQNHFRAIRDLIALELEQENYQSAEKYLKQAFALNDDHPDLLFAQGKIQQHKGQHVKAKKTISEAIKEAKKRGWYYRHLSEYLAKLN